MKKVLGILLIGIHLLSTTELSELMKMPLLVNHYLEHRATNKAVTVISFLDMHYNHGNVKDSDYQKDMQLPFKSHDGCINLSILIALPHDQEPTLKHPEPLVNKQGTFHTPYFISSACLSAVWQPPRFC